jgi:hypothetical protein
MRATKPGQPAHLLLDVIDVLSELTIPYAVIGAFATSLYGIPRYTNDADALIWLAGAESSDKLHDRLIKFGFHVVLSRGDLDDPIQQVIVVNDDFGNTVDLLSGIRGMDPAAATRVITTSLLNTSITVIGLEDLIAMKLFAAGPQDIIDVEGMLQVSGEHLDAELLRRMATKYGPDAADGAEKLLQRFCSGRS